MSGSGGYRDAVPPYLDHPIVYNHIFTRNLSCLILSIRGYCILFRPSPSSHPLTSTILINNFSLPEQWTSPLAVLRIRSQWPSVSGSELKFAHYKITKTEVVERKKTRLLAASELMWPKYLSGDDAAHGDEAWLPVRLLLWAHHLSADSVQWSLLSQLLLSRGQISGPLTSSRQGDDRM